jgi:hypothetical protein
MHATGSHTRPAGGSRHAPLWLARRPAPRTPPTGVEEGKGVVDVGAQADVQILGEKRAFGVARVAISVLRQIQGAVAAAASAPVAAGRVVGMCLL